MRNYKVGLFGPVPSELGSTSFGGVARMVWELTEELKNNKTEFFIAALGGYSQKFSHVRGIDIYGYAFNPLP